MQHRLERGLRVVTRDGGRDKCSYLYDHERLVPKVELNPVVIGSATSVVNDDAVLQENLGLPSAARSGWTRAAWYPGLGEPAMEGSGCGRHFLAAHQFRPLSRVVSGKERGTRWERLEKRGARKGGERHRGQGDRAAAECACSRDGGGVNEILHVVALHSVQLYSRQQQHGSFSWDFGCFYPWRNNLVNQHASNRMPGASHGLCCRREPTVPHRVRLAEEHIHDL